MRQMRAVALSVAAMAVAGTATFTVLQATGDDAGDGAVQDNLMATDLSKDEYV
ncbi:hypothetical protein G3I40_15645 [Streptomyces sp. SID14478]|uniref:hypothetical protein n=1 Tax=Streptomyces sp. SID14478 TaxID=2706073 RepID=UPI0013DCB015|nr:hypothetical protein [Streptomyces sp. SID14478]NEB76644.1 hypothetical protein [Streptomyces sp. SID14478]